MRMARISRVALAFALLLSMGAGMVRLAPAAAAQTTSTHDLAKTAPDDALLYVDLSLDTTSTQWKNATTIIDAVSSGSSTSVSTMAADAGIEGGEGALIVTNLDALTNAANGVSSAVSGSSGAGSTSGPTSGGLTSILGGVVKSALPEASPTANGAQATAAGIALVVKPTDMTKAWTQVHDSFTNGASSADATATSTTYKTVKIESYPGANGTSGEAIAQVGDYIVWAESPVDIQSIVDVVKGDHKSLADVANFTKGASALTGDHFAFGFLNGQVLGAGITKSAESSSSASSLGSAGSMSDAINELVGANHDTAFQISATDAGLGIQTVELPNGGSTASASASGTASSLTAASKVPADTLVFINGFNLGKSAVMQALGLAVVSIFSGLAGDTATPVASPTPEDMYAATAGFLGFNLQKDFLDQLTGKYVFALWANGGSSASSVDGVLASDAANPVALQLTTSGLGFLIQAVGQGSASVATVTYGTSSLSEATIGTGSSATKIDFGVADKEFILALGDGAKTYLTGVSSSLANSADFKAAFAGLPTEYDGMAYVNVAGLSAMSTSTASSVLGATPVAGVEAVTSGAANVKSFAMVSYKKDGLSYTSSLLLIEKK